MVEGPSDMLLLPSMFRAALGPHSLGFHFLPGLSVSAQENNLHAPAIGSSNGMFYLIDGDGGGAKLGKRLISAGIDQEDIFTLRSGDGAAVEPEDFIEPTLLLEAINRLLAKHHEGVAPFVRRDLTGRSRMAGLETAFKTQTGVKLPKVELAYEILDLGAENPQRGLLDERRSTALAAVCRAITARVAARELRVA